jgi:hypothetical protein
MGVSEQFLRCLCYLFGHKSWVVCVYVGRAWELFQIKTRRILRVFQTKYGTSHGFVLIQLPTSIVCIRLRRTLSFHKTTFALTKQVLDRTGKTSQPLLKRKLSVISWSSNRFYTLHHLANLFNYLIFQIIVICAARCGYRRHRYINICLSVNSVCWHTIRHKSHVIDNK